MIYITMVRDYNKEYNIKFDGMKVIDLVYQNGKLISVKERGKRDNHLSKIYAFKEHYNITTDDVITIVDMYFADKFSIEYIGHGIFD